MSNQPQNADKQPASSELDFNVPHVNKRFAVTVACIFLAMLVLPTLIWGVLTVANAINPSIMETLDFDTGENRTKAEFPKKFDPKSFTAEVEAWYNDHLPFRSVLYKSQEQLKGKVEAPYRETVMPFLLQVFHGSKPDDPDPKPDEELILNPFEETTEAEIPTETETIPVFETEETAPIACEHVLSTESHVITEATCTEWGIIGYACENCDYVKKEYSKKIPHSYVSSVPTPPICGTKYDETMTCSACSDSFTKTVVKKHVFGEVIKVNEPTQAEYGYTLNRCADCGGEYRTDLSNRLADNSYLPPLIHNQTLEGKHNWLFYLGNDSLGFYQGTNLLSPDELVACATTLQQLNDICNLNGKKLVIGFWPNKELIYSEFMPDYSIAEEVKRVQRLTAYIENHTNVSVVYPLSQLKAAKPYWQIYYKHDTHWNNAGGYIATQELYKELGYDTVNLIDLPVVQAKRSGGDLINIGGLSASNYTGDVAYSITYKPDVTVKVLNPNPINSHTSHTTSNGAIDKKFVMLSDSFRGGMAPFLQKDFTNCLLTHRSQVRDADVVAAIKEADIIVISTVERNDLSLVSTARIVTEILLQTE